LMQATHLSVSSSRIWKGFFLQSYTPKSNILSQHSSYALLEARLITTVSLCILFLLLWQKIIHDQQLARRNLQRYRPKMNKECIQLITIVINVNAFGTASILFLQLPNVHWF
jgi:hypothetical protein